MASPVEMLQIAAKKEDIAKIELLLDEGVPVDGFDQHGQSPLMTAALQGRVNVCHLLLEHEATVNLANKDGVTALFAAATNGHAEVCAALLKAGAFVNLTEKNGEIPLHAAAEKGHFEVCKALLCLEHGTSLDRQNKLGATPLCVAAQKGHLEICRELLGYGASANLSREDGITPLHYSANKGNLEVCSALLDHGASVESKEKDGATPLFVAAQNGHIETCRVLLLHGASVDLANSDGSSPLWTALLNGHAGVCHLLLDNKANVNFTDTKGRTVLHIVAERGDVGLCRHLVDSGATLGLLDNDGCTADALADRHGYTRLAQWLRKEQLFQLGTMKPNTIVLRLGGPPGSGKSTVADSFTAGKLWSIFRRESQTDEGDRNPHQRTKGVRLVNFTDDESVNGVLIDLGGQGLYFMTHQALISVEGTPVINAIVLSSLNEMKQLEFDAAQWASFFACRIQPGSLRQPLLLFATRADRATIDQKTTVSHVFEKLKTDYASYFSFPCKPFIMDARKSRSVQIIKLRSTIHTMTQEVLNAAALQPSVCEFLQEVLPAINKLTTQPLIKKTEFLFHMGTVLHQRKRKWHKYPANIASGSLKISVLDLGLEYMTRLGKVVAFRKVALKEYVIIKPAWIYTALVGLIMSEHPLPEPYVKYKNGYAKLADVIALLKTAHPEVSGEFAVEMLSELGFMIVFEDKALVPVKLEEQRPEKHWPRIPRVIIVEMVFAGRRIRFIGIVAPSSALFPLAQAHFYHLFMEKDDNELPLWAGGIRIASGKYPGAEAIIEAHPNLRCIDIIVRGRVQHAIECCRLLQNLYDELTALMIEHSPGSNTQRLFLSGGELAYLSEVVSLSAPEVEYTAERVKRALEACEHVTNGQGSPPEDPACLMLSDEEWRQCGPALPDDNSGRALTRDDVELYDISTDLAFDMPGLERFAAHLLHGSGSRMTGDVFLASLDVHVHTTVPSKTCALLKYWIEAAPAPSYTRCGGQLTAVILRVGKGPVARAFKSYLMGD